MARWRHIGVLVAVVAGMLAGAVPAQVTYPPRIGEREFVLDRAEVLSPEDEAAVRAATEKLLVERDVALVVVTIPSLAEFGAGDWSVERYAGSLYNEWGIGTADAPPNPNRGMLLLVVPRDRKARIELGAGWGRGADADALRIMDEAIVPRFREGDYSGGVRAGVEALTRLAAGQTFRVSAGERSPAPDGVAGEGAASGEPPGPGAGGLGRIIGCVPWPVLLIVVFLVARSLIGRRSAYAGAGGGGGLGWMMLPMILGGLGGLGGRGGGGIGGMSGRGYGTSGGLGSGGRTFGGGFSGRGGATGSW